MWPIVTCSDIKLNIFYYNHECHADNTIAQVKPMQIWGDFEVAQTFEVARNFGLFSNHDDFSYFDINIQVYIHYVFQYGL